MIRLHSNRWTENRPLVLVATNDDTLADKARQWLERRGTRVVRASSAHEAVELIQDTVFLGIDFHGLLVDHNLPDATGVRVIHEFQREYQGVPVALTLHEESIAVALWARARGVQVLSSPLRPTEIFGWAGRVRPSQVGAA